MAEIKIIAEFFFLSLALGVGICTPLANSKETGGGLIKLMTSVTLAGALGALSCHLLYAPVTGLQSLMIAASFVCMVFVYVFHRDHKTWVMWLLYAIQNLALLIALFLFMNRTPYLFFYGLSSVLLLGSITYAMLLGHWYLVTPKLSVSPLKRSMILIWIVMLFKLSFMGQALTTDIHFFVENTSYGAGYAFNWIMLTMRVLWGYVIIGVMSYFAWRLISMRSTQSATGILYAMTFFVLVGELIANFMYFTYGMFL